MRRTTLLIGLLAPSTLVGCGDPALVDGFRQRDRDVAAVFEHIADEIDSGRVKTGPVAVKAVNDGLSRITEPAVVLERIGQDDSGDGLRAAAVARRAASGGVQTASIVTLMLVSLISGVLLERYVVSRRTGK